MTAKTYAQSQLDFVGGKRASWFKDNARERRVTVEMTRQPNGDYYINSAKANYNVGGSSSSTQVGVNNRLLRNELLTSNITTG
jgi:hypothetical protein